MSAAADPTPWSAQHPALRRTALEWAAPFPELELGMRALPLGIVLRVAGPGWAFTVFLHPAYGVREVARLLGHLAGRYARRARVEGE
jgi:hypothetical protein